MFRSLILQYNCFWRCRWIFLTSGWMAFLQKLLFVFTSLQWFLTVLQTHFMHRWSTWSTVVRCLQNHAHFRSESSYISFRYVVGYRRNIFVLGEMYCYNFMSGKTYLVIQTWRIVKWFWYPSYHIGCYPWKSDNFTCHDRLSFPQNFLNHMHWLQVPSTATDCGASP